MCSSSDLIRHLKEPATVRSGRDYYTWDWVRLSLTHRWVSPQRYGTVDTDFGRVSTSSPVLFLAGCTTTTRSQRHEAYWAGISAYRNS